MFNNILRQTKREKIIMDIKEVLNKLPEYKALATNLLEINEKIRSTKDIEDRLKLIKQGNLVAAAQKLYTAADLQEMSSKIVTKLYAKRLQIMKDITKLTQQTDNVAGITYVLDYDAKKSTGTVSLMLRTQKERADILISTDTQCYTPKMKNQLGKIGQHIEKIVTNYCAEAADYAEFEDIIITIIGANHYRKTEENFCVDRQKKKTCAYCHKPL